MSILRCCMHVDVMDGARTAIHLHDSEANALDQS